MFIHVSTLKPDQAQEFKGDLHQSWLKEALSTVGSEITEYSFSLSAEKKGDFIELDGQFSGSALLDCVRCIEKFNFPFKTTFRLFMYKDEGSYVGDGGEHELKQDDMEFSIFQGDKIDVGEVLREQLILSLPDYPVCNPSCQGINT